MGSLAQPQHVVAIEPRLPEPTEDVQGAATEEQEGDAVRMPGHDVEVPHGSARHREPSLDAAVGPSAPGAVRRPEDLGVAGTRQEHRRRRGELDQAVGRPPSRAVEHGPEVRAAQPGSLPCIGLRPREREPAPGEVERQPWRRAHHRLLVDDERRDLLDVQHVVLAAPATGAGVDERRGLVEDGIHGCPRHSDEVGGGEVRLVELIERHEVEGRARDVVEQREQPVLGCGIGGGEPREQGPRHRPVDRGAGFGRVPPIDHRSNPRPNDGVRLLMLEERYRPRGLDALITPAEAASPGRKAAAGIAGCTWVRLNPA